MTKFYKLGINLINVGHITCIHKAGLGYRIEMVGGDSYGLENDEYDFLLSFLLSNEMLNREMTYAARSEITPTQMVTTP